MMTFCKYPGLAARAATAMAAFGIAACQTTSPGPTALVVVEEESRGWARAVSTEHLTLLESTDAAWAQALAAVRAAGPTRRIVAEGPLLEPDSGQAWVVPSPGSYRCRRVRLGRVVGRASGVTVTGPFFCHIGDEGDRLSLTQQTGPERAGGYLWPDGARRMIFVGALARGREALPPGYGDNPERDVVGLFERIGPLRYRLVLPRDGSLFDVIELVPAPIAD